MKRYEEIRKAVKEKIESGEWSVGYKLPKETELCRLFDVSRTTVRRALSSLTEEGLLRRIKGTGTFVSRPQIIDKTTFFIQSFAEELRARDLTCVTEVLEFRMVTLGEEQVAKALGLPLGARILKLRRLRYSKELGEGGPITLSTSYFPEDIGAVILRQDPEKTSLYWILKSNGISRVRSKKTFSATRLSARDCRMLSASAEDIFFLVASESYDKSGRPIEYCESYYPIDRNVFTVNVNNDV